MRRKLVRAVLLVSVAAAGCQEVAEPAPLELDGISPDQFGRNERPEIIISGSGFLVVADVDLGGDIAIDGTFLATIDDKSFEVTRLGDQALFGRAPGGLKTGRFDLIVADPLGRSAILEDAVTIDNSGPGAPKHDRAR